MKQFFTLAFLVFISLSAEAQVGTVYRLQGTAGGTVTASTNGTNATTGFRRSAIWKVVSSPNALLVGTNQSPTTGATLQIFGITLSIPDVNDLDLSAFVFNIQIRSEGTSATTQNVGMLHSNDRPITLGAGSSITLGWDMAIYTNIVYFYPGYLHLQNNDADIIIGSTTIASTGSINNTSFYLNANAYLVSATSGAQHTLATGSPASSHIMSGASAPTANITNKTVTRPGGGFFTVFPLFYNASAGVGGSAVAPLPVQLISFNATKTPGKVVLNWATAQEINSDYFEVQRSTDALTWKTVAQIKAAGNSGNLRNYKFEDAGTFTGNVYYRIKMVDNDATFSLSNIARLSFAAGSGKMFAYPNPAASYTVISSNINLTGNIKIEVVNAATGVRILQQVFTNPGNSFRLNTNQLTAGNYIVKIFNDQTTVEIIKLAKY